MACRASTPGTVIARMGTSEEKPYKIYKGGRDTGKVPLERRDRESRRARRTAGEGPAKGSGRITRRSNRRRLWLGWTWRRWTLVTILGLVVLFVVWGVAGYLSVSSGVSAANARVPKGVRAALAPDAGLLYSTPTNILLVGTDHATGKGSQGRSVDQHSDSLTLLRTDPGRGRLVYLSIPRDLQTTIPGYGDQKINAAMQLGGPTLAIKTVDQLLCGGCKGRSQSLRINHVVFVDFNQFESLINAIGGITVNVPENIRSNKFDCPFPAKRCTTWQGWRFHKGPTHMNGHKALIFSRIRENTLPGGGSFTDFARQHDQQLVEQATLAKLSSPTRFFSLPFDGSSLLAPISTDLSTWQLLQLAWVKFRSSTGSDLHCRLGGTAEQIGGQDFIVQNADDIKVLATVFGNSAPQPPAPGNLYGPGCVVGSSVGLLK
jgi:polyisoprenyl-teichoic acid--peptidoglycan teichoic acid transferase